jgi:putative membrane protein
MKIRHSFDCHKRCGRLKPVERGGGLRTLFHLHGSVFPYACFVGLPCLLLTTLLKVMEKQGVFYIQQFVSSLTLDPMAYGGFSTLLGFVVVFRTSEAYSRFWDGNTLTHQMRGDWFDACSGLMAYSRWTAASPEAVENFRQTIVRLFSMLHAMALADLEDAMDRKEDRWAFTLDLIDPRGIDEDTLLRLKQTETKVELIYFWIQGLIVESVKTGLINTPAPIVTRAWGELANGMLKFHECLKIANVPLPFPYSQTTLFLLVIHWLVTPVMMCTWTDNPFVAGMVSFIQVFVLWSLHAIAQELENPFGADANDLNVREMNNDMKIKLLMLVDPANYELPKLMPRAVVDSPETLTAASPVCFQDIWNELDPNVKDGSLAKVFRLREVRRRRRDSQMLHAASINTRGHSTKQDAAHSSSLSKQSQRSSDMTSERTSASDGDNSIVLEQEAGSMPISGSSRSGLVSLSERDDSMVLQKRYSNSPRTTQGGSTSRQSRGSQGSTGHVVHFDSSAPSQPPSLQVVQSGQDVPTARQVPTVPAALVDIQERL